jgi:hypothetical protein
MTQVTERLLSMGEALGSIGGITHKAVWSVPQLLALGS